MFVSVCVSVCERERDSVTDIERERDRGVIRHTHRMLCRQLLAGWSRVEGESPAAAVLGKSTLMCEPHSLTHSRSLFGHWRVTGV